MGVRDVFAVTRGRDEAISHRAIAVIWIFEKP